MDYKLGILDQSPIFPGKSAVDALQSSINLAQHAEKWGYHRFWVSEHHQSDDVAGVSPEVLISHLLAKTSSIKLGSGGVMLQHYSPYKVVENFHLLATLEPGRVELGLGKAPGGFSLSTKALRYGATGSDIDFDERLLTLQKLVHNSLDETHPLFGVKALPRPKEVLPTFLLGASTNSAKLAAELGMNFVFARFLNGSDSILDEAVKVYRDIHPKGKFIVSVATFAAASQDEAEEEARNYKIFKITLSSGRSVSVQSPEQVEEFRKQTDEPFEVTEREVEMIAGTPTFVKEELDWLADAYQIDEFILHTPILNEEKRLKSFELLGHLSLQSVE
ncbi:LLM class flavin-dependent oxidoreductase [Oceanobacillus sp. Castelsardo]|uniref:LLM class flavin-dependent oxidoreductase n=1 Tax=Oceanobacillus sp. Castelsardo TaxID=1851204 RepID=UPI000837B907|nr:LLM class flavin-dependent oxidoreductase [Oceanobacillus sp. Castelsardo]